MWKIVFGRFLALSFLSVFSSQAFALSLLPSEMKGWSWYQSTILAGISQPSRDLGTDLQLPVPNSHKTLSVRLWKSSQVNKGLFLILPGTGGGASSGISNVLAEAVSSLGYDSLVLANPFSAEFQASFSADGLIGLPQKDAADARRMMESALELYQRSYGRPRKLILMGSSLGALYTVLEATRSHPLPFDAFIALNPPVSLSYAMSRLDDMIRVSLQNIDSVPDLHFELIWAYFQAQRGISTEDLQAIRMFLPSQEGKGSKVIGESFQSSLKAITRGLFASSPELFEDWKRRGLESQLGSITFERYIGYSGSALLNKKVVFTTNFASLLERINLVKILEAARDLRKVHVITSADDFLLRTGDLKKLEGVLGSQLHVFEAGGHCGVYWAPSFKEVLAGILRSR